MNQRTGREITWSPRIQLNQNDTILHFMQVLDSDKGLYVIH